MVLVHSDKLARNCFANKIFFNFNCFSYHLLNNILRQLVFNVFCVQKACEVLVKSFVSADKLICGAKTRHQSPLLKPINRAKRPRKKYSFDNRKRYKSLLKRSLLNPALSPQGFLLNAINGFNSVK